MSKKSKLLEQVKSSVAATESIVETDILKDTSAPPADGVKRLRNAKLIDIDRIHPDPDQPRKTFDDETLSELADSIRQYGILQPIAVEPDGEGHYRLISGERRYQAARKIGLQEMPCIVQDGLSDSNRFARQLIENLQREDLSPIDKAVALLQYKEKLSREAIWEDVERTVGISSRRRKQYLALLNLPEFIQKELVATGGRASKNQITEKHARALLLLNNKPEKQKELFERIKSAPENLSGENALTLARELKGTQPLKTFRITYRDDRDLLQKLQDKITQLEQKSQ